MRRWSDVRKDEVNWNWIKGQKFKKNGTDYVITSVVRMWDNIIEEFYPSQIEFKTIYTEDEPSKYFTMPFDMFEKKITYKDSI